MKIICHVYYGGNTTVFELALSESILSIGYSSYLTAFKHIRDQRDVDFYVLWRGECSEGYDAYFKNVSGCACCLRLSDLGGYFYLTRVLEISVGECMHSSLFETTWLYGNNTRHKLKLRRTCRELEQANAPALEARPLDF